MWRLARMVALRSALLLDFEIAEERFQRSPRRLGKTICRGRGRALCLWALLPFVNWRLLAPTESPSRKSNSNHLRNSQRPWPEARLRLRAKSRMLSAKKHVPSDPSESTKSMKIIKKWRTLELLFAVSNKKNHYFTNPFSCKISITFAL